ncbi:MAG: hypothetical protein ACKO3P_19430, partial [Planctomycetaceae bacterium]
MSADTLAPLCETTFSESPHVDREAGVIRGVKILGKTSRNQRDYSPEALAQAARLYEGLGVNVDHPRARTLAAPRQVADGLGWLAGVHVTDEGVYGDLHYLRTHPQAAMLAEAAERNPRRFGLSHNAEGRVVRRAGRWVVESVARVHSVDVVQNPATNQGLFESCAEAAPPTLRDLCVQAGCAALLEHPVLNPLGDLAVPPNAAPGNESDPPTPADWTGSPCPESANHAGERCPSPHSATTADVLATLLPALAHRRGQPSALDWSGVFQHLAETLRSRGEPAAASREGATGGPAAEGATSSVTGAGRVDLAEARGAAAAGGLAAASLAAGGPHADPGPVAALAARIARLESEGHCRGLLEQAGRASDPERLAALMALPDDPARRALLETWPPREAWPVRDVARGRPLNSP